MMRSLRNRLIAATLTATLLILLGAATLIYGMIRGTLVAECDETLLAKAKAIAAVAEEDEGRFELDLETAQMPEFEPGNGCEYFQIWDSDGATLTRSSSLTEDSLNNEAASEIPSFRFTVLPDGRPGRQVTLATQIRTDWGDEGEAEGAKQAVVAIAVARDTLDLNQTLSRLLLLLGAVTLGAALLSVAVLVTVVRFTLKPVGALAAQIAEIDASHVSKSGELSCPIEELDPVVQRLNDFLDRLDKAFVREKAFTADVAHELRTPLAGLSAALEVCSSRPRDEAAYQDVVVKCLGTTRTMQAMIENLLMLARADARQLTIQKESLNLFQLATECWRVFEERAVNRGLHIEWKNHLGATEICTDREKCGLILSNLFDNAVRHSDHGGKVIVEIVADSNEVTFGIHNTGCDLPSDEAGKVFERFWMHDNARTLGPEHCGLGLSLCRKVVEILGGSIAASVEEGTFAVSVRLPVEARITE